MKLFHLSDLHIGKQLHQYNLAESQCFILDQIADRIREHKPDAVLIAGDIFDRSAPSGEAYTIFDDFLNKIAAILPAIPVMIISGNHDSARRLQYASSFFEKSSIFISALPPQNETEYLKKVTCTDEFGEVDFYLLPFVKPGYVRHLFPEGIVTDYGSAVKAILQRENIDFSKRNVLISHQFYVSGIEEPSRCDSEQTVISVGGLDSLDVSAVMGFDYVALGHIHQAQKIGCAHIRYSGTPLKYSVSEAGHHKSITEITLSAKNTALVIENIPLISDRDVCREQGKLNDILDRADEKHRHDYVSVTLTDENEIYHPKEQLEEIFDHLLEVRIDNSRTRKYLQNAPDSVRALDPAQVFMEFYETIQKCPISPEEMKYMQEIICQAGEEERDE